MLKNKARSAVIWSGIYTFSNQGIGFVISVFLARLLVPEDFGTIALLSLFMGLATLFVNAGFSQALIQKQSTTHVDESTVFWFNIGVALLMTAGLIVASPWIAEFFSLPVLMPLTMLMACNILISSAGSVQATLLTKQLEFKVQMKVGTTSTLVSGCTGVYMAWADYGVWALAGQAFVGTLANTTLMWVFSAWRPSFIFNRNSLRQLFNFSGWLFAAGLLDTFYQRGYALLIGKFYGMRELGIYNRADRTQALPINIISRVLSRVLFPLFSSINDDKDRLRQGVKMSIRSIMLITAPIITGLAVLAEPLIQVVFGDQWLPAVPIMQVLCFTGLLYPLQVINLNILQAQGQGKPYLKVSIAKKVTGVSLLLLGSYWGVMGIAWCRVIQSCVALMINGYYTNKILKYSIRDQLVDCSPSIILSTVMAVFVALAGTVFEVIGPLALLMLTSLGAVVYILGNLVVGVTAFKETVSFLKGRGNA